MIDNEFSGKVKRFRADHRHVVETEFDDAQYVLASDYDALKQQLDALELSRRSWMDEAKCLEARLVNAEAGIKWEAERNVLLLAELESDEEEQDGKKALAAGIESLAQQIYQAWESLPGFKPWIDGGNSAKQDEARQIASRTFELALANQIGDES